MFIHKTTIFVQNVTLSQIIVKNGGIIIVQERKKSSVTVPKQHTVLFGSLRSNPYYILAKKQEKHPL